MIADLNQYIIRFAERGACTCGRCIDAPANPEQHQPTGHTADLGFFKVKANEGASADELKRLIQENRQGEFADVSVFDGVPHDFIELGGWLGSQELALMLIGLGKVLGLWDLIALPGMVLMVPKRSAPSAPAPTPAPAPPKKWKFHVGIHRGTLTSRDSEEPVDADSLEQCREWARKAQLNYASLGCQIWFCYAVSPEGERTTLIEGAPYR